MVEEVTLDFGGDLVIPVRLTVVSSLVGELESLLLVLVQRIATRHV